MLKKAFIVVIVLCAFSSLAGVFLAGLNIYTRSTTAQEEMTTPSTTSLGSRSTSHQHLS